MSSYDKLEKDYVGWRKSKTVWEYRHIPEPLFSKCQNGKINTQHIGFGRKLSDVTNNEVQFLVNEQQLEAVVVVAIIEVVTFVMKCQLLWPGLHPKIYAQSFPLHKAASYRNELRINKCEIPLKWYEKMFKIIH